MADQEVDNLFGDDGQALDAKPASQTQKEDGTDASSTSSDDSTDSDSSSDSGSSTSSGSSSSSSGSDSSAQSGPRNKTKKLGAKKRQRGKQRGRKALPQRNAKKRRFGEEGASAPKKARSGDSGDEYDSGEEVTETAADRDFVDEEGDDPELLKEYKKDKQDWSADEDRPKRRKGPKDVSEDISGGNRTKNGKRKGLSDEEKDELVLKTLRLMRKAAQQDIEDKLAGKPAVAKLKALAEVRTAVAKEELTELFLNGLDSTGQELAARIGAGRDSVVTITEMFREWLRPLPGSEMPNLQLREAIYDMLSVQRLGRSIEHPHLRDSRLGPILFALSKSPRETEANRHKLQQLIDKVSAGIFGKKHVYKEGIKDMLQQQEALGLTSGPRFALKTGVGSASAAGAVSDAHIDSLLGASQQGTAAAAPAATVLPKDLPRHARIPAALVFDYTHSAKPEELKRAQKATLGAGAQGLVKKMVEDKRQKKMGLVRGVKISIEGRGADT